MKTDHKTDHLIKKKLEQLDTFPGPGGFDPESSWERLRLRMEKPVHHPFRLWKLAAAILVLVAGGYGYLQWNPGRKTLHNNSAALTLHTPVQSPTPPHLSQNTATDKAVMPKEIEAQKPMHKSSDARPRGSLGLAASPSTRQPQTHQTTPSQARQTLPPSSVSGPAGLPEETSHADTLTQEKKKRLPSTGENAPIQGGPMKGAVLAAHKRPVVHLNELDQDAKPSLPSASGNHRGFMVRITEDKAQTTPLLANQHSHTDLIKINLSPKK